MKYRIFTICVCSNIFDHTHDPEPLWEMLWEAEDQARKIAIRLTLLHPITMIPVIIDTLKYTA